MLTRLSGSANNIDPMISWKASSILGLLGCCVFRRPPSTFLAEEFTTQVSHISPIHQVVAPWKKGCQLEFTFFLFSIIEIFQP